MLERGIKKSVAWLIAIICWFRIGIIGNLCHQISCRVVVRCKKGKCIVVLWLSIQRTLVFPSAFASHVSAIDEKYSRCRTIYQPVGIKWLHALYYAHPDWVISNVEMYKLYLQVMCLQTILEGSASWACHWCSMKETPALHVQQRK